MTIAHHPGVTVLGLPPIEPLPPLAVAEPVALYRHLDAAGYLLYVGITSDPARRWEQHCETSLWARFVATTYVQWFASRASAARAEQAAIACEAPIFNAKRRHNGRAVTDRKVTYLRTGRAPGLWRRVPCTSLPGEVCITCGPDSERWLEEAVFSC